MQPPASLKALGDPIYEAFYGLTEQPFAITTDPRFFFLSASHQRAFSELLNGLRRRESMLLVTGETGTGKSTLCRAVLQTLGERTFSAMILNPYMAGAEVLRIVLRDFGLVSNEDLRRGSLASADVPQLMDTLEGFLKSLIPLGSHAVIVMDEAQSLAPAILDQIRLLTSLEHNRQRLVQVILCGQPGLLQTLKAEPLHALNERITRRVELLPLPAEEVGGYIQHRLGVAGGADAVSFDEHAALVVGELSRGLPRRINVLCDRALQEGRIEGVSVITADLVKRAARALAGVHDPTPIAPAEPVPQLPPQPPPPDSSDAMAAAAMLGAAEHVHPEEVPHAPQMVRELNFGQPLAQDAPPRTKKILIAAGVLAALLGGYGLYAWSAGTPAVMPSLPPSPAGRVKAPIGAIAVPTDAEVEAAFQTPRIFPPPRPIEAVPGSSGMPAPPAELGANPDNRN